MPPIAAPRADHPDAPRPSSAAADSALIPYPAALAAMLALVVGCWTLFAGTEPFYFGHWLQSEPITIAAALIASLAAASLVLAVIGGAKAALFLRLVRHPALLLLGLFCVWGLLSAPWHLVSWASWFGYPEQGEGIWSWLALLVFVLAAWMVRAHEGLWKGVLISGGLATLALSLVVLIAPQRSPWTPFFFPDFTAFLALYAGVALYSGWPRRRTAAPPSPSRALWAGGREEGLILGGALAVACVALIASQNKTAYAILLAMSPMVVLALLVKRARWSVSGPVLAGLIALFGIVITLGIYLEVMVDGWPFKGIPVLNAILALLDQPPLTIPTIESRAYHLEIIRAAMANDPLHLVTGYGWGSFIDVQPMAIRDMIDAGHVSIAGGKDSYSSSTWDAINANYFHSHNYLGEALMALGLPGLILAAAWPACLPLAATPEKRLPAFVLGAGFVGFASGWFQFPGHLPLMAIAIASVLPSPGQLAADMQGGAALAASPGREKPGRRIALLGISGGVTIAMVLTTAVFYTQARRSTVFERQISTTHPISRDQFPCLDPEGRRDSEEETCSTLTPDFGRGGIALMKAAWRLVMSIRDTMEEKGEVPPAFLFEQLALLLSDLDRWQQRNYTVQTILATVLLRNNLYIPEAPPAYQRLVAPVLAGWGDQVEAVLHRLPGRTDLAAVYYHHLLARGDERRLLESAEHLLLRRPQDPVGLWFSGIVLLGRPGQEREGLRRMRLALDRHLERLMHVEPATKREVLQASAHLGR